MVDEMDLLSGLKVARSVRPNAYEEARQTLRAAMASERSTGMKNSARRRNWWASRRTAGLGIVAAGAAAAAVTLVATSSPAPAQHPAASGQAASGNALLTRLAADITTTQVKLPGDATLEIRNQSPTSTALGDNGIDLYTDGGTYYYGTSKSNLEQVLTQQQSTGQGAFKRAIAAALTAEQGDVTTARAQMAVANLAPGTSPTSPAARQAALKQVKEIDKARHVKYTPPKPLTPAQQKEQTDNFIWMNSLQALTAAPENPNVRAGVLAIMATMPNVKVTHTSTAGHPTLTLSDSWPLLALGGTVESMIINASTGMPLAVSDSTPGQPVNVVYYHPSRVTVAQVEAGKF